MSTKRRKTERRKTDTLPCFVCDAALRRRIEAYAEREGVPIAEVLRCAYENFLADQEQKPYTEIRKSEKEGKVQE